MIDWTIVHELVSERLKKVFTEIPKFEVSSITVYPEGYWYVGIMIGGVCSTVSEDKVTINSGEFKV